MRDLADGNRDAVRATMVMSSMRSSAARSLGDGARDDVDALLAGAHRRHRHAADQRLQRLRDVLRRQAEGAGARLIDFEPERRHRLAPVEMGVDDARVLAHDVANARGDFAHLVRRPGPMTRNCTGKPTGGPKLKRSTRTRAALKRALGDRRLDPRLDPLARLDVLGDDDDLREGLVGLHRQQAEPEARRALADIGGVGARCPHRPRSALRLARGLLRRLDRAALGEPHFEEQFGPLGQRKELLLNLAELAEAEAEQQHGGDDDDERAARRRIRARGERRDRTASNRSRARRARWPPRRGFGSSLKPRNGVNSTATNQEATSAMPTTQKMPPVYSPVAELARPIGMKPAAVTSVPVSIGNAVEVQAKDAARSRSQPCSSFTTIISTAMIASSTSRPSAMISAPSVTRCRSRPMKRHGDEDDREHQRHGGRDDEARAPAERDEAHAEHDRQRFEKRTREFEHRRVDHFGLIGDARIDDPARQVGLELGERRVERLAERENIAALLHDDADFERGLALGADEIGGRVLVAVRHVGDVAEAERLAVGEDRRFRHRRDALERAGDAQRHALRVGLKFAGRRQRVLLGERIEQRLQRHAERGELGVAEFDEDPLAPGRRRDRPW